MESRVGDTLLLHGGVVADGCERRPQSSRQMGQRGPYGVRAQYVRSGVLDDGVVADSSGESAMNEKEVGWPHCMLTAPVARTLANGVVL